MAETLLDRIADEVVITHTCHCDTALERPADDEPDVHVFTVDGDDFPWPISDRGPLVTRMTDDLYGINVEILLVVRPPDYRVLDFNYASSRYCDGFQPSNSASVPYIPVIGGTKFPWLLTSDDCHLVFGHKTLPTVTLTFFARNVDTNLEVDDRREHWAPRAIWCEGGNLIKDGLNECSLCGELIADHFDRKHPHRIHRAETESNGPARDEAAIEKVRTDPENFFHSARKDQP